MKPNYIEFKYMIENYEIPKTLNIIWGILGKYQA